MNPKRSCPAASTVALWLTCSITGLPRMLPQGLPAPGPSARGHPLVSSSGPVDGAERLDAGTQVESAGLRDLDLRSLSGSTGRPAELLGQLGGGADAVVHPHAA